MKPIPYILAAALCLSSSAVSANPVTYICKTANGIVFTNQKTGAECTVSMLTAAATVSSEEADSAVPETVNLKEAIGQAAPEIDDIKILPRPAVSSVTKHRRSRQSPPGCETAQPAGYQSRQSACHRDEPQSENPSCARCIRTCEASNVA